MVSHSNLALDIADDVGTTMIGTTTGTLDPGTHQFAWDGAIRGTQAGHTDTSWFSFILSSINQLPPSDGGGSHVPDAGSTLGAFRFPAFHGHDPTDQGGGAPPTPAEDSHRYRVAASGRNAASLAPGDGSLPGTVFACRFGRYQLGRSFKSPSLDGAGQGSPGRRLHQRSPRGGSGEARGFRPSPVQHRQYSPMAHSGLAMSSAETHSARVPSKADCSK